MNKKLKEKILKRLRSINKDGIEELIEYLENRTDYFEAPASSKYHSNFRGGLALHSDYVVELLLKKNKQFKLNLSESCIYLTGYLHDICKCNIYKEDIKLRKNSKDQWEGYKTFSIEDNVPIGHGEKSVIIIQQFLKLSLEETMMIRWHMGPYVSKNKYSYLNAAINKSKAVLALYTADIEASTFLENIHTPEICSVSEYNKFISNNKNI